MASERPPAPVIRKSREPERNTVRLYANPRPIDRVLERLEGVKAYNGYYKALCPAHDDGEPSLSVSEGDDCRVLLKCFAGCSFDDVVVALELEQQDLFTSSASDGGRGVSIPRKPVQRCNTPQKTRIEMRVNRCNTPMQRRTTLQHLAKLASPSRATPSTSGYRPPI
jgi:DNA primase